VPDISINKPALRTLYRDLSAQPNRSIDVDVMDQIVAIVGDKKGVLGVGAKSSAQIEAQLKGGQFNLEQKLTLASAGLDANEKADIKALLSDATFSARLSPVAANFLKALAGLEPLANIDRMVGSTPVVANPNNPAVQAAAKLRELVKSGKLDSYYDAAIGAVDNPALKAEAEALFAALPTVKMGMTANDFVTAGLWTVAPRGVAEMQQSARYLPGRQLQVKTNVFASLPAGWSPWGAGSQAANQKIGTYDPNGPLAVTYRAVLVGDDPANANNFLVKIDGHDAPVSVSKQGVYEHNHPHELASHNIKSDTKRDIPWGGTWAVDYASPLAKAKLCEIALKMDEFVQKLDFTKTKTEALGGLASMFGRGDAAKNMVDLQKSCVETVFRSISMKYPKSDHTPYSDPGRASDGERDVARQAIRGTGMCVQQSCVFGALLMPFMDVLGVDGQYRSGNCFRNIKTAVDNVYAPDWESGHGWWQITFRPSMEMTVTDRTWNQVNLPLDRAYGFPAGDRNAISDIRGYVSKKLRDSDVNVTGSVTVQTLERQFAQKGDGRDNHLSNSDGDGTRG
jgi:hypothetical protein